MAGAGAASQRVPRVQSHPNFSLLRLLAVIRPASGGGVTPTGFPERLLPLGHDAGHSILREYIR